MNLAGAPSVESIMLERLRYGVSERIGAHALHHMEVSAWTDHATQSMAVRLCTEVLAHRQADMEVSETKTVLHVVPASPWHHWRDKHRGAWWMRWLTTRRPPKMLVTPEHVTLTAHWRGYAKFPDASIVYPKQFGAPVYCSTVELS